MSEYEPKHLAGRKASQKKGRMARRIVYFCIGVLFVTAIWAAVLKTISVWTGNLVDLTDILVFVGGAFGGELGLCCLKRIFAKDTNEECG